MIQIRFQDFPWDLIYDDNGELIGEVYTDPAGSASIKEKSL